MRWWGLAGLVAGSLLTASACSGDDDAASPGPASTAAATTMESTTTEPPATTTTTTTTVESTTTTTESTTAAPEPTAPPTTSPSPENVPPRVTFPDDPEKQAVVDAVYAFSDLLFAAQADPSDETLRSKIASIVGEPVQTRFLAFLDRVAGDGQAFRDDPSNRSYLEVYSASVTVADGSALVDACAVDRTMQVEIGGNADGSDRIIDDTVFSAAHSYSLTRTDQGWFVVDLTVFGEWEDQVGCGG